HGDLEAFGPDVAAHARERHAVGADFAHLGLADVRGHVRGEVRGRVVHLVQELLLHRAFGDEPAGRVGLGDDASALRVDFRDRKTHALETGHVLDAGIGAVAAGDLRAALEQVAGHGGPAEARPVVSIDAVVHYAGTHEQ